MRRLATGWWVTALGLLVMSVAVGLSRSGAAMVQRSARVAVGPIEIEPERLALAPDPDSEEIATLARAATARAVAVLRRAGLAEVVEVGEETRDRPATYRVTGTVRLPVSLPPALRGLRAYFHPGRLATAELVLCDAEGTIVSRSEAAIQWDDVRWTRGAHQTRRARPTKDVLKDAVGKAVERAAKEIARTTSGRSA